MSKSRSTEKFEDLLGRTRFRGQLDIFGQEVDQTFVIPCDPASADPDEEQEAHFEDVSLFE